MNLWLFSKSVDKHEVPVVRCSRRRMRAMAAHDACGLVISASFYQNKYDDSVFRFSVELLQQIPDLFQFGLNIVNEVGVDLWNGSSGSVFEMLACAFDGEFLIVEQPFDMQNEFHILSAIHPLS